MPVIEMPVAKISEEVVSEEVAAPPAAKTQTKSSLLELQPMDPPIAHDLKEIRTLVQEHFPNLPILDRIPTTP